LEPICHHSCMTVAYALAQVVALNEHIDAANFLKIVRDAVLGFLAIVFVIGGLLGFFLGRAVGRRR
jgi:hypothetical protein